MEHAEDAEDAEGAADLWPLDPHKVGLLVQLAELIRRHGAERFVEAALVRADQHDFPDPWRRTVPALRTVIQRLLWHAYLEATVVIEDARGPARPDQGKLLDDSDIDLVEAADGRLVFHVVAIGDDNVAGLLAHQIGLAFVKLAPPDPFRGASSEPTDADGTLAAVFLGLGVLAANSSIYVRYASQFVGRVVREEHKVATAGGLELDDLAFLLAVQELVRAEPQPRALATLSKPAAERFREWRAALEPHRDELRSELALAEATPRPLSRAPSPPAASDDERDRTKFNAGRRVYRVPFASYAYPLTGLVFGAFGILAGPIVCAITATVGTIGGFIVRRPQFRCSDPDCQCIMQGELATCPGCGGAIAMTIAHANERLARDEELDAAAADDGDG